MVTCSVLFNTFFFTHLLIVSHVPAINIIKKHRDKRIKTLLDTGFINRLVSIGTHKIGHKHFLGNCFPIYAISMYKIEYSVYHIVTHLQLLHITDIRIEV